MDGRFRRINPAWESVLGWRSADLIAAPYLEFVHPDDQAATAAESEKLAHGATTLAFENRYRCQDGSYRWLSWKAAPLLTEGLLYAVARDVTERKTSERALHSHAAELADANRELEAFSYSVSHDLRAPLRHIDGFAQALVEDYADRLDATGLNFLSRIRAGAQRMGTLIDDLLSLSRVTRTQLTRTEVDLTSLVRDVSARLQEEDPKRPVEWRIAPALRVRGDARLLRVALENLLGNAWKFTSKRADPVIEFSAASTVPDGDRTYVVRDNGAGFDMAHAPKLFGAFQRLHGAAEFPGSGIGLATVQRIVRRHGGRIWAESSVGAGATFSFTLEGQ
jgi:PAS domain S-box-containing protein